MGLSPTALLCFSLFCLFCSLTAAADDKPTAYEILQSYDFPVGLLPKGVTGYVFDNSTGKFSVDLSESCSFSLENSYQLKYKSPIKGTVSKDKLSNLQGITVKVLLFWVNIIEVTRSVNDLQFSVGIASADFPLESFIESPQCGCGFDCNDNVQVRRRIRRTSPFVSSS